MFLINQKQTLFSIIFALFLSVTLSSAVFADDKPSNNVKKGSPEWLARMFFISESFPEKSDYITGEVNEHQSDYPTMGEYISKSEEKISAVFRVLDSSSKREVYAITYRQDDKDIGDYYCFIYKEADGKWRIGEIRALVLGGIFAAAYKELTEKKNRTDYEEYLLSNMKLTLEPDSYIKQYLRDRIESFEKLTVMVRASDDLEYINADGKARPENALSRKAIDEISSYIRELRISSIFRDEDYPDCVRVIIGGMVDNSVGYMYVPDGSNPPRISQGNYIYVEKVLKNWYIFKTT